MGHGTTSGKPGEAYRTIDIIDGIKVIRETDGKAKTSIPIRSFTSGTYIVVDQNGTLAYIGIYQNGLIARSIDIEQDGKDNAHVHEWEDVISKKGKASRTRKYPNPRDPNHKMPLNDQDRELVKIAKRGAANGKYKLPPWF